MNVEMAAKVWLKEIRSHLLSTLALQGSSRSSPGQGDLGCSYGNVSFSPDSRIFKPLELPEGAFGGLEELPGVCGRITDTPMTFGVNCQADIPVALNLI